MRQSVSQSVSDPDCVNPLVMLGHRVATQTSHSSQDLARKPASQSLSQSGRQALSQAVSRRNGRAGARAGGRTNERTDGRADRRRAGERRTTLPLGANSSVLTEPSSHFWFHFKAPPRPARSLARSEPQTKRVRLSKSRARAL